DVPLRQNVGTRWKYGRARAAIAISGAVARALESSGIPASRVHLIPSGVELERRLVPASATALAELGVPAGSPIVVQVGQLDGDKDPLTFVRGIAELRKQISGAHGVLVGEGPLRSEVARAIASLALQESVHLAGYRTDADALIAAAGVVTLTSTREGLGSVLLDALVAGRPVVASRAGRIHDAAFEDETGFLVPSACPSALGSAIARILGDPALAARLSAGVLRHAPEFGMDAIAERTLRVYDVALAST